MSKQICMAYVSYITSISYVFQICIHMHICVYCVYNGNTYVYIDLIIHSRASFLILDIVLNVREKIDLWIDE